MVASNRAAVTFLGDFPRELRDLVYELVLIDGPKVTRRHVVFCPLMQRSMVLGEASPFLPHERCHDIVSGNCECGKRRGLGLLLANRQLHAEGAPIFWARNVFNCENHDSRSLHFLACGLRKEYRELIRHVTIYDPHVGCSDSKRRLFTDNDEYSRYAILKCKALRMLDVTSEMLKGDEFDFLGGVKLEQPALDQLSTLSLEHQPSKRKTGADTRWIYSGDLFVICQEAVPWDIAKSWGTVESWERLKERSQGPRNDSEIDQAVPDLLFRYMGPRTDTLAVWGLSDVNSVPELTLQDGSIVRPVVTRLPNSEVTILQHRYEGHRREYKVWRACQKRELAALQSGRQRREEELV